MSTANDRCSMCGVIFPKFGTEIWSDNEGGEIALEKNAAVYILLEGGSEEQCFCENCVLSAKIERFPRAMQSAILYQLGLEYRDQGRNSEAIPVLLRASQLERRAEILDALGHAYWSIGEENKAILVFRGAIDLDPADGVALEALREFNRLGYDI